MGSTLLTSNNTKTQHRRRRAKNYKPIVSYTEAVDFKDEYDYPFTQTSLSFTATSNAEVKYEATKTDPEIAVIGVDEHFINRF
jgi:putative ABC transport system permease protein